jgi:hypothetical protein
VKLQDFGKYLVDGSPKDHSLIVTLFQANGVVADEVECGN